MSRFIIILTIAVAGLSVTGCSTSFLMQLNTCRCFVLQRGVTPQQFVAHKSLSWFGPRTQPRPKTSETYRLGDDQWEVWVYDFSSEIIIVGAGGASQNPQAYTTGGGTGYEEHNEYVAFRNGRLEEWGRGELPKALRRRPGTGAISNLARSSQ